MNENTADSDQPIGFDLLSQPDFSRAPQPYYKRMRDSNPVMRTPSMYGGDATMVWVSKNSDINTGLRCPELFSSKGAATAEMIPAQIDPPEHLKYRKLLDPLFAPREMNKLEDSITKHANELIDAFIDRGSCEYASEYAIPLPCTIFLRLMGLPLDDLGDYLRLSDAILRGSGDGVQDARDDVRKRANAEIDERFAALVAERRRAPRDDLLTQLLAADIEGEPLSPYELVAIFRLLLVAGLDTVTDSLTCFYTFLGRSPDHRRRLAQDPEIIPAAVEEMMRYESPVPYLPRVATEATELSGCPIKAGESVVFLLGSANTDEAAYENPQEVDFDREAVRHLAFGGGIHRCLGSHLARLELRVSLREWHRRIPEYHIPEDTELQFSSMLRQVEHLPIVFDEVVG